MCRCSRKNLLSTVTPVSYYSNTVFQAQREEIKETLTKTNARYLYLTKFESYTEELPYSPGDSGVKKIFENANVTIWERE